MRSVLLSSKATKREELGAQLEELETDPKLLDSVREFVSFHSGIALKRSRKSQ